MNTVKMEIEMTVIFLCATIVAATTSIVDLTSQWKADFGWEVTCSWNLFVNDSRMNNDFLQSVRLMDRERQFLIYRPEINGPEYRQLFKLPDKIFQVDCKEISERGVTGKCVMSLELFQPITDDMSYACEVSGERPYFREEKKDIQIAALVPPSHAVIEVAQRDSSRTRVVLNCTSSGLPAPSLLWSIGEQRVPQDFSGKSWNVTSKLWHSWSLLSYNTNNVPATCTPETNKGGQTVTGDRAEFSSGSENKGTLGIILGVLSFLVLSR